MEVDTNNWHYNFRDKKKLPDIKVLQREFNLSVLCIGVAVILLIYYLFGVVHILSLSSKVRSLEREVNIRQAVNNEYLALNKEFKGYTMLAEDVKEMYALRLNPLDILACISKALPTDLIFQSINFKETQSNSDKGFLRNYIVSLDGFIHGSEEEGLEMINRFKSDLMSIGYFKDRVVEFRVENLKREEKTTMLLNFVIKIQMKAI